MVRGDATLLRMLLRNLVENAHRYSPEGTHITIHISADPTLLWRSKTRGRVLMKANAGS
ncbi:two-component sensor kinase [Salmonella enterica subsp. enterica]|uniref:Two-component sensor kinase n=1 Tax=Salmonella enterica I TaxID=59201 RepID=A0A379X2X9_SALET|nr:two-component sensor kinase [Salmonella enterica subsp. enterica]